MELLVSTEWLAARLGAPDLRILDATYFALEPEKDAAAAFAAGHIPGARFLDLPQLADPADPLPGMAPPAGQFAARMGALGIGPADRIVLYDQAPHHTSARAWWLFRLFGVDRVALLDGGFAKWWAEGRPVESGAAADPGGGSLAVSRHPEWVRDKAAMLAILAGRSAQILDARSAPRFTGEEGDPRPAIAPGHIPGSRNLPYGRLFNPDGTWMRGEALAAEFVAAGVDLDRPIVTTCGSGVTASVLLFGLALLGRDDGALYDGSWSEWGADPATPKATGG